MHLCCGGVGVSVRPVFHSEKSGHPNHYIIQVSSKPIPAFKVVIRQLRMQQTSVTYLALVLANHRLLHYDVKHKNKNQHFWLHLSCQDGSSPLAPLLCDRALITPGGSIRKSCEGGASHALRRRGLPSVCTSAWDTAIEIAIY